MARNTYFDNREAIDLMQQANQIFHGLLVHKFAMHTLSAHTGRVTTMAFSSDQSTLASGGTGDVLTGMIAGLLAAGIAALDAASGAAFLHGLAGRLASDGAPTTSVEVAAALPDAIRAVTRP